jgi:hypothetical protein
MILVALIAIIIPARSAEIYQEAAVKAAFLYRFTGYVEWPTASIPVDHFTIAVLGSKPVLSELERVVAGRTIKDRPASVRPVTSVRQAMDAQLIYLGSDFDGDLNGAVNALAGKPILVVADDLNGLDAGAVLSFVMIDRRVRFDISLPAAQQANLKISSELLGVAASVRGTARPDAEPSPR